MRWGNINSAWRVSFIDSAERFTRGRELGITDADIPRNAGKRRTASKKALLKGIEELGGKW